MSRDHNQPTKYPVPAPENISNREYYTPSTTNDATDAEVDFPSSPSSSSKTSVLQENVDRQSFVHTTVMGDLISISNDRERTPSPTPSDIILRAALLDVAELTALNDELQGRGMGEKERMKELLELRERREKERENDRVEKEKGRQLELEREYEEVQRRGREEV